jgi:hypothetical protein
MSEYFNQIKDVMSNAALHMKERDDKIAKLDSIKQQIISLEKELMWRIDHINVAEWARERDKLHIMVDYMNREGAIALATWIIEMTGGKVSWD